MRNKKKKKKKTFSYLKIVNCNRIILFLGTLFILPTAGYLCTRKDIMNGWPAIFYLSGLIAILVALFWIPMGADKPSKQYCISRQEQMYIESRYSFTICKSSPLLEMIVSGLI